MTVAKGGPIHWGNVVVPYTALWTGEVADRVPIVRWERWNGKRWPMLCEGVDAPSGKPLFTILHGERTRRVVRERLCQMCVRPMPPVVVAYSTHAFSQPEYGGRPVIRDGLPMCPSCALAAFRFCPGLQRHESEGRLRIWKTAPGAWDHLLVVNGEAAIGPGVDPRVNALVRQHGGTIYSGPDLLLREFHRMPLIDLVGLAAAQEGV